MRDTYRLPMKPTLILGLMDIMIGTPISLVVAYMSGDIRIAIVGIAITAIIAMVTLYYTWKEEIRNKQITEIATKEQLESEKKRQEIEEKEYRPLIVFYPLANQFQTIGDATIDSDFLIENQHKTKQALNVKISFKLDKENLFEETVSEIEPKQHISFSCRKQFAQPGKYTIELNFQSEHGHQYFTRAHLNSILKTEESWRHWVMVPEPSQLWILKDNDWQEIK